MLYVCVYVFVQQGKLGPIDTRVHKAEQYFNQTGTDCSVSSCPELLRRGEGDFWVSFKPYGLKKKGGITC